MEYSEEADMAGRKLDIRYDHPALNADLFTPLVHAKDMPPLHRLLKGKHKEMNLTREIERTTESMRIDGVHVIPVHDVSSINYFTYNVLELTNIS